MGENGIKARSLSLLSFPSFHVQSNWYVISSLSVLRSKRQCFRRGSILFYLELLFLFRKLLFSPFLPENWVVYRQTCVLSVVTCELFSPTISWTLRLLALWVKMFVCFKCNRDGHFP